MGYVLGIDLGTTFSAAAVHRDGRAEVVAVGGHAPVIPSVVFVRPEGDALCGDAAQRRAAGDPTRVAREFKRRFGDPAPILLAGRAYSAEDLTAVLLRSVVAEVVKLEGSRPDRVAICHPATWGPFKQNLLRRAVDLSGTASGADVVLVPEPVAAAVHHAASRPLDRGDVVAVYDLGGGTFDAAVLQRTVGQFDRRGDPQGVERLGGVDFDAAVLEHVRAVVGAPFDSLDLDDPQAVAAAAVLRSACTDAKEALSSEAEVDIGVLLPSYNGVVRLTRGEFEDLIRPALGQTVACLERALASAAVPPSQLAHVLLVGGSSRIPLVAELVSGALGRPVTTEARPKLAVALGAAIVAAAAVRGVDAATQASTTSVVPVVELPRTPLPAPSPSAVRASIPAPSPTPTPTPTAGPPPPAARPVGTPLPPPNPRPAPSPSLAPAPPTAPPTRPVGPTPTAFAEPPPVPPPAPAAGAAQAAPLSRPPAPPAPAASIPPPPPQPPEPTTARRPVPTPPAPRRRSSPVATVLSLVLMVAIAAGVFAFVWSHRSGGTTSTAAAHTPADVKVLVLNGSGVGGVAGKGVARLQQLHYPSTAGNAGQNVDATEVFVISGFEGDGAAVATGLGEPAATVVVLGDPRPPEVTDPGDAKVVVVLSKASPLAQEK